MAWIEINKTKLFHNLDYFSNLVNGKNKLAIGLKDNAYGHGIETIAKLCIDYGITNVFVKNDFEAKLIERFNFETILILNGCGDVEYVDSKHIAIVSIEQLKKVKIHSNIELKVDTGMHRNGVLPSELSSAIQFIIKNKLNLKGVFTHFSSADEDNRRIYHQEECFQDCIKQLSAFIKYDFRVHCGNSCGAHKVDVQRYDIFRVGIGAYGYIDIPQFQDRLKPILTLMATKISTRNINKSETVGYGGSAFVNEFENFMVSCYDIGYGDGFFRLSEDKVYALDDGRKVLGRVSMDSLSIEGDDEYIELFNDASRLAKVHNTITYEIITALSPNLKRIIVE